VSDEVGGRILVAAADLGLSTMVGALMLLRVVNDLDLARAFLVRQPNRLAKSSPLEING
jgi:hypothetical protein